MKKCLYSFLVVFVVLFFTSFFSNKVYADISYNPATARVSFNNVPYDCFFITRATSTPIYDETVFQWTWPIYQEATGCNTSGDFDVNSANISETTYYLVKYIYGNNLSPFTTPAENTEVFSFSTSTQTFRFLQTFETQNTRITNIIPQPNSATSTSVIFQISYFSGTDLGDSTPNISVTLVNQDDPQIRQILFGDIDTSFGSHTTDVDTENLPNGLYYMTTEFLNSPLVSVSTSTAFVVGTSTISLCAGQPSYFCNQTFSTSTIASSTSFMGFLNVPSLLKTKVPFAYIFQVSQVFYEAITASTSTALPTSVFVIVFPAIGTHASTSIPVDLFSTTTITHFLTPTFISLFRTLEGATIILGMLWFLYHEAKHKKLL